MSEKHAIYTYTMYSDNDGTVLSSVCDHTIKDLPRTMSMIERELNKYLTGKYATEIVIVFRIEEKKEALR